MNRFLVASIAAAVSLALWAPSPSEACMHIVEFTKLDAVAAVSRAERWLARGQPVQAYQTARRARRELERELAANGRDRNVETLIERSRRITAVAVVRLNGHTPVSRRVGRTHVTRGREGRSLAVAHERLRSHALANPEDLRAQAHYAEAMARIAAHRDDARQVLSRLAARDLMPDAHGYAALLRLVEPGSDAWQSALQRCQQMAADHASRICPASSSRSS